MSHYKRCLTARKGVVTRLINLALKAVEDEAIRLVDLEDSIKKIEEKHEAVLEYWALANIKIKGGETMFDEDVLTSVMSIYEDQYYSNLVKLIRYAHMLASQVIAKDQTYRI